MTDSKPQILDRICRSLARPSIEHPQDHLPVETDARQLFASAYPDGPLVHRFGEEFKRVSGELQICSNAAAALDAVKSLIGQESFRTVAVSRHSICQELGLMERLSKDLDGVAWVKEDIGSENPFARARLKAELAQVQLGITGADYLIADTGTIVMMATPAASRLISLLPVVHLVLATPSQLRPNLAELVLELRDRYGKNLPGSALTLITGPSRTADIEKVLIKGVHGPTRLLTFIVESLV